ncbi:MAC/perforin domain-containing protein [Ruminococcus sp.]|uniref:MAC/perforin domain-containing protein n=1 Tax=Ruminococcus sp. TaxID=41978 RepID=UPI002CE109CF|nr:MAC/perforin domain-containing protein [Ruminococcus sp.]HNZ99839.1 MAC/perforin domain-containing protein [Ruminococcus sp.]HOH88163.1 MAC/perforin domain-containing protein [Ruminococcus sp.]
MPNENIRKRIIGAGLASTGRRTRPTSTTTSEKANSVIGYGINALTAKYPGIRDVPRVHPILNASGRSESNIDEISVPSTDFKCAVEESLTELSEKFSFKSSANASFCGFKAGFEAEYSNSKNSSEERAFTKIYALTTVYREHSKLSNYAQNLDPQFSADLNSSLSPATFFERYGTHLIVGAYYGGRADVSLSTLKRTDEETSEIKTKAEAGFKEIAKVSTSTEWNQFVKSMSSRSDFHAASIGGTAFDTTSMDSFPSAYKSWLNSFNKDNSVFCGIPENGAFIPVWELTANSSRRSELMRYYDSKLAEIDGALSANDSYVTDIVIVYDSKPNRAKEKCPNGYYLIDKDLNKGCGSDTDYIYLCYKLGGKANAVRNVLCEYDDKALGAMTYSLTAPDGKRASYKRHSQDLNHNGGGKYIYLLTTKDNCYNPIRRIDVDCSSISTPKGRDWSTVTWKNSKEIADVNKGCGGKTDDIYIRYKR